MCPPQTVSVALLCSFAALLSDLPGIHIFAESGCFPTETVHILSQKSPFHGEQTCHENERTFKGGQFSPFRLALRVPVYKVQR